jgi:uncharacterized PurR-regulated membrane protein YhhQ (DUF165 family)
MFARFVLAVAAMVAVVAASNFLVQFPVQAQLGPVNLADLLTWGAFTYPVAFLVTDLTNRHFGPQGARLVVVFGFVAAVVISVFLASPRIAIASGTAFLIAQLLDVSIFDRLRASTWWRAPLISSVAGSVIDTLVFFSLAFAAPFAVLDTAFGREDGSLTFPAPFLGIGAEVELWTSLAAGDFVVKLLVAAALLAPYKVLRGFLADRVINPAAV